MGDFETSNMFSSKSNACEYRYVNGNRKSPFHTLTEEEIAILLAEAESIGIDTSVLRFNYQKVKGTSYIDALDVIAVNGNVLPDHHSGSAHPRDLMSSHPRRTRHQTKRNRISK